MTIRLIEFETITNQELQAAAGGFLGLITKTVVKQAAKSAMKSAAKGAVAGVAFEGGVQTVDAIAGAAAPSDQLQNLQLGIA
jgi:hypothetical protein